MIELDLADILSAHFPRTIETFTIQRIERTRDSAWPWMIHFIDTRVTHRDTKQLVGFRLDARVRPASDGSKYTVVIRAECPTGILCRAEQWVEEKLKELKLQEGLTHLTDRFFLIKENGRFKIVSKIAIVMLAENALPLVDKAPARTKDFLQSFDKVFLQVAGDLLGLIQLEQCYTKRIRSLNA